ncbi:MAG: ABC transporter ATP-binding protein [Lachnospiraceae bacterium]|nr:ABC transporter ATP-binding protein [Lachnospiraceae bacterium]
MSIEVNAGTFSYRKEKLLLQDISFSIGSGEILAILGPNGVGKTTLMKCLLGFLPWQSGMTSLDGTDIRAMKGRKLWQQVAYVPQARQNTFSYHVEDMVLLGRSPYLGDFSMPGKKDREIAEQAMELAGVTHLIGKSCSQLSGGELQLVLIARALAAEPSYLVLDEPESGLDFRNQLVVLDLVERLSREKNMTVILNTHYPDHALRVSDQVLLLFGQGIYQFGRTEGMLTAEHMRALFGVDIAVWREMSGEKEYTAVIPLEILPSKGEDRWINH